MSNKIDMYVHAALLLHAAGKEVTSANIVSVVKSAGATADEARAKVLADALHGKNMDEMLEAPVMAAAVAAPASTGAAPAAKKEEPKDEKKSEEQAAAGLAGLFG